MDNASSPPPPQHDDTVTSSPPPPSPLKPMPELLPDGIITDILSRLPAQSVCVCRCVCKLFLTLTTPNQNPSFAKLHFSRRSSPPQILIRYYQNLNKPSHALHLLDPQFVTKLDEDEGTFRIKPMFPLPRPRKHQMTDIPRPRHYSVVNSCNGMVCLANRRGYPRVVYNPITREYVLIPKRKSTAMIDDGSGSGPLAILKSSFKLGFGHCGETNRFKVLRMYPLMSLAEIHVLGTDSWRKLETALPSALEPISDPVFLNGCLNWDCDDYEIISFDFRTEIFGEVPLPTSFLETHKGNTLGMTAFEGCLSVSHFIPREYFNIWVMREYGIQESWTMQFVIDMTALYFFTSREFQPIGCLGSGELLMQAGRKERLLCYDFLDKSFRFLKFDGHMSRFMVYLHTPSFVSLKDVVAAEHVRVLDDCWRSDQGEAAVFLKQYDRKCVDDALLEKIADWQAFGEEFHMAGEESWSDDSSSEYYEDDEEDDYDDL